MKTKENQVRETHTIIDMGKAMTKINRITSNKT